MNLERAKAKYNDKISRYFEPTETKDYIPNMKQNYEQAMAALAGYQDQTTAILNDEGVPGARRAAFMAFTNMMYQMCISKMIAGAAAEREALAYVEYLTVIFAFTADDRTTCKQIATVVYSVDITLPTP